MQPRPRNLRGWRPLSRTHRSLLEQILLRVRVLGHCVSLCPRVAHGRVQCSAFPPNHDGLVRHSSFLCFSFFLFFFLVFDLFSLRNLDPWSVVVDNAANLDNTFATALRAIVRPNNLPPYNILNFKCSCHTMNLALKHVFDPEQRPGGSLGTVYDCLKNIRVLFIFYFSIIFSNISYFLVNRRPLQAEHRVDHGLESCPATRRCLRSSGFQALG